MTTVEDLAPWISLLAAALSIGYVVVREYRHRRDTPTPAADGGTTTAGGPALGDVLQAYAGTVVTAVTLFTLAGLLQLTVDVSAVVPPAALWLAVAALVVVTALGQVVDADEA